MTEKAERLRQLNSCVFDPTSDRFVLTVIFEPRCDNMSPEEELMLVRKIVRDAIANEYYGDKQGELQKLKDLNLTLSEDNAELASWIQGLNLFSSNQQVAALTLEDELTSCKLQLSTANKSMSELGQVNAQLVKDRQNMLQEITMLREALSHNEQVCKEADMAVARLAIKVRERAKVIQQQCNQIAGLKKAALELKHARTVIVPTFGVPYGEYRK